MERYKKQNIEVYVSHFKETKVSPISSTQGSKKVSIEPKQLDSKKIKKNTKSSKSFDDYLDDAMREDTEVPLDIGDTVLYGKFMNKQGVVKAFGINDKNQPTIILDSGKEIPMLKFRIQKLMK